MAKQLLLGQANLSEKGRIHRNNLIVLVGDSDHCSNRLIQACCDF